MAYRRESPSVISTAEKHQYIQHQTVRENHEDVKKTFDRRREIFNDIWPGENDYKKAPQKRAASNGYKRRRV
jgi:hypothetical protein